MYDKGVPINALNIFENFEYKEHWISSAETSHRVKRMSVHLKCVKASNRLPTAMQFSDPSNEL
jgi:hypothetical protein